MIWKSVNEELPPKGTYLCIVKTFVETKGDTYSMTQPYEFITQCTFDPGKGWKVSLNKLGNWEIIHWAVLPEVPSK